MVSLLNINKAQSQIAKNLTEQRLQSGLTQQGLADRAGVALSTLRKFEQKGLISLSSFLKLSMALGSLASFVEASEITAPAFSSIDDVLKDSPSPTRKKGWRS